MKRMLVITRAPWLNDNAIGRTMSDFFSSFTDFEIYSICLREAPFVCSIPIKNFYISESQIINGIIKHKKIGKISDKKNISNDTLNEEVRMYSVAKRLNLMALYFVKELLWSTNRWKNKSFKTFLDEVNPDVIFFPDFPCIYAHKVLKFIYNRTNAKVAIFHADDCYTLKHFSLSPLFWIYRLYLRKHVKESVEISDLHFVISDVQKKDYDRCFNVNNIILTRFASFDKEPNIKKVYNNPLQLVYTGNIGINRWKTLALIARALKIINKNGIKAQLRIYTATEISKKIRKALDVCNSSFLMGKRPAEDVEKIQENADILVHVEAFDLKNRLIVRQSFSTKIVDYLKSGRAILAVGPQEVASIKHLKDNNCAMVASSENEIINLLSKVLSSNEELTQIARRGFECGKKYHNKDKMLKMLHNEISQIC